MHIASSGCCAQNSARDAAACGRRRRVEPHAAMPRISAAAARPTAIQTTEAGPLGTLWMVRRPSGDRPCGAASHAQREAAGRGRRPASARGRAGQAGHAAAAGGAGRRIQSGERGRRRRGDAATARVPAVGVAAKLVDDIAATPPRPCVPAAGVELDAAASAACAPMAIASTIASSDRSDRTPILLSLLRAVLFMMTPHLSLPTLRSCQSRTLLAGGPRARLPHHGGRP